MQSRLASNVDMGPCQPARVWEKSFVYYLKAVALIGLRGHERGGKRRRGERSLVAAALPKKDAGVALLVQEVNTTSFPQKPRVYQHAIASKVVLLRRPLGLH